jgi:hypothetical protein
MAKRKQTWERAARKRKAARRLKAAGREAAPASAQVQAATEPSEPKKRAARTKEE